MTYCTKCGKPTNNGIMCEDCIISNSPWLLSMKNKEDDLVGQCERLKSENAELHERLERSIELPFFQEDGEARILVYRDKNGIVCTELYFEDEIYWGRHGDEAAEARFEEIRKDD